MSTLTIKAVDRLIEIDLDEPTSSAFDKYGYFNGETWGGNVYLYVDGEEYGSLFVHQHDGKTLVTLGQYDDETQEWVTRNDLRPIPAEAQVPMEENR